MQDGAKVKCQEEEIPGKAKETKLSYTNLEAKPDLKNVQAKYIITITKSHLLGTRGKKRGLGQCWPWTSSVHGEERPGLDWTVKNWFHMVLVLVLSMLSSSNSWFFFPLNFLSFLRFKLDWTNGQNHWLRFKGGREGWDWPSSKKVPV